MGQALKSKADLDQALIEFAAQGDRGPTPSRGDIASGAASWMHWRLVSMITDFEGDLADDQEVALQIQGRPAEQLFYLESIAFWNPDMIVLIGTDASGGPLSYTHHTSQLGYTLVGAPKIHSVAVRISEALKAGLRDG